MGDAICNVQAPNPHAREAAFPLAVRQDIIALKPAKFKATEEQIRAIEAHVAAPPKATLREIAESAGVPETTLRSWLYRRKGYGQWLCTVLMTLCSRVVPRVWQAVIAKALDGSERAAHMVLIRFDLGYREAQGKPVPKSMRDPEIPEETLKEAKVVLDAMEKAKDTKEGDTKNA